MKDLIFYFKCRAGHYTLPIDDYVKPNGTRLTRHSSDQNVLIPKCRTKLSQFSYFIRIANLRNTLPESTCTLTSLNQCKSHVLQRYHLPFAGFHPRGTKPAYWDAKITLGQDQQMACIILNGNSLCLSCPSAKFASQYAGFVPREWKPAKGLFCCFSWNTICCKMQ